MIPRSQRGRRHGVRLALVASVLAVGTAIPAFAADDTTPPNQPTQLQGVKIVGTRIRKIETETATPVVVIDRKQIEDNGFQTVAEILGSLTQSSGGTVGLTATSGSSTFGQASVDLRDFGSDRTLVLVDGRRLPVNPFAITATQN